MWKLMLENKKYVSVLIMAFFVLVSLNSNVFARGNDSSSLDAFAASSGERSVSATSAPSTDQFEAVPTRNSASLSGSEDYSLQLAKLNAQVASLGCDKEESLFDGLAKLAPWILAGAGLYYSHDLASQNYDLKELAVTGIMSKTHGAANFGSGFYGDNSGFPGLAGLVGLNLNLNAGFNSGNAQGNISIRGGTGTATQIPLYASNQQYRIMTGGQTRGLNSGLGQCYECRPINNSSSTYHNTTNSNRTYIPSSSGRLR